MLLSLSLPPPSPSPLRCLANKKKKIRGIGSFVGNKARPLYWHRMGEKEEGKLGCERWSCSLDCSGNERELGTIKVSCKDTA